MRLKLQNLRHVVRRAKSETKLVEAFRLEVKRVLGPIMDTSVKLEALAEQVNDRVAVLTRTGRTAHLGFQPGMIIPFANHSNYEVRSMAANLLPQNQLGRLANDPHSMVRSIVAQRAELTTVREMMRRFPRDENLRSIYQNRKVQALNEEGVPQPKVVDEPFDMYGEKLGDAVKQGEGPDLSDDWYITTAQKLFQMYDKNLEWNWEEKAVAQLVQHTKSTTGVEIDAEKLLKAVEDYIEEREERALERNALKELASRLDEEALMVESTENLYTDHSDAVSSLLESSLSSGEYVKQANKVFQVREAMMPEALKKHNIGERRMLSDVQKIPVKGRLPHGRSPRSLDERALDLYVRHWNALQRQKGEPMKLDWNPHPSDVGAVSFAVKEAFEQERPVEKCNECKSHVQAHARSHDGCGFMFECTECDYGWES